MSRSSRLVLVVAILVLPGLALAQDKPEVKAGAKAEVKAGAKFTFTVKTLVKVAITKTRTVIILAADAVNKGGAGKAELRKAVVHNMAARAALKKDKVRIAAHLTLKGRASARVAIKANQDKALKAALAESGRTDQPAEIAAAEGIAEEGGAAEATALITEAEKTAPPEDKIAAEAAKADVDPK